jgi:hypothetical protein
MVSAYLGERLVNRFSRKTMTTMGILLLCLFIIYGTNFCVHHDVSEPGVLCLGLGSGVGGLMLLFYDWEFMSLALGAIGLATAVVVQLVAIDPTKIKALDNRS